MAIVFVASSTEAKGIAEKVAQALEHYDQRALRWWDAFQVGDVTLDRLRSLSDTTDGAVLVWDADDTTWQRGQERESTRDNCILEYGLFVSKLGRQRTAVLVRDTVRMPSDISGITVVTYNEKNLDARIKQLTFDLRKNLVPKSPDIVPIYVDKDVQEMALAPGSIPTTWAGRALYVTDAGASRWLRMTRDPKYPLGIADPLGVVALYIKIVRDFIPPALLKRLGLIVSLGPGGAHHEQQLLDALASAPSDRLFEWIPVDISHGLLSHSVSRLMGSQAIPMGIVGDHEEGLSFVFERLLGTDNGNVVRPSMLITMFGGTFANLDGLEGRFIGQLKARLVTNDYVLIDMPVKGSQWAEEADPRTDTKSYSPEMREFIGAGLADRLGVPDPRILEQFTTRVVAECTDLSDVPGTTSIDIVDSDSRQLLLRFRRYDLGQLKDWLSGQDGLELVTVITTAAAAQDVIKMAIVLLRKT
jgi:hypothetical protein